MIATADVQDGWKIETRKRMSGKLKGSTYKVFLAPSGAKYYSMAKAVQDGGFKRTLSCDGRMKRRKKT